MTNGSEHISASEFRMWLASANPGERITYLTGFLGKSLGDGKDPSLAALVALQSSTYGARGRVCLVQRRLGRNHFEYIAVKRGATPSLMFLQRSS